MVEDHGQVEGAKHLFYLLGMNWIYEGLVTL